MKFLKRAAWSIIVTILLIALVMLELYDKNLDWLSKEKRSNDKNLDWLSNQKRSNDKNLDWLSNQKRSNDCDKDCRRDPPLQRLQSVTNQSRSSEQKELEDKLNVTKEIPYNPVSRVNNVVFLKLHKSASTTVQNIFLRYGFFQNLSFVLPKPPGYYWRNVISLNDTVTKQSVLPPPRNRTYNILCSHVIYNRTVFQSLMPRNTKYIGIIREPRAQFLSTLKYVRPHEVFNRNGDQLKNYLKNPHLYESLDPRQSFTNNRMAVEFGFPLKLFKTRNTSEVQQYIQKLDEEFDLVLLVEKIDESLILMKRILRWSIRDIIYIIQNKNEKNNFRFNWTGETERQFRSWNYIDYELYNYFKAKMFQRIMEAGENLRQEVTYFRWVLLKIQKYCADNRGSASLSFLKSRWSEAFKVFRYDCWLLRMEEITFHDFLRIRQYPELRRSNNELPSKLIRHFEFIYLRHNNILNSM